MTYKPQLDSMIDRSLNYGRDQIKKFITKALINKHNKILDIGAGKGHDLLNSRVVDPSAELHGIEIYEPYMAELRHNNIIVHSLDIEHDIFPLADESFDIVIANQILEHVKDIYWVLHEISRVLKINGHLIVGVPNLASFHNRLLLLFGKQPSCIQNNSAHVRGYTKDDLIELLDSCFKDGFKLELYGGSNFYPLPAQLAKPLAKLFPNLAWSIFFMFKKKNSYGSQFLEFPVKNKLETNFYVGHS